MANIMENVLGYGAAAHEPPEIQDASDVVVDPRLRMRANDLADRGHRIVHLVRDGRDVVRSLDQWYRANTCVRPISTGEVIFTGRSVDVPFAEICIEWRHAVNVMSGHHTMRVEDMASPEAKDQAGKYTLPHWTEWSPEMTDTFWSICGKEMDLMGYER